MANEAHKEPTMEEILASIRKIISDDDVTPAPAESAPVAAEAPVVTDDAEGFDALRFEPGEGELDDSVFEDVTDEDTESFPEEFDSFSDSDFEISDSEAASDVKASAPVDVSNAYESVTDEVEAESWGVEEEVAVAPEAEPEIDAAEDDAEEEDLSFEAMLGAVNKVAEDFDAVTGDIDTEIENEVVEAIIAEPAPQAETMEPEMSATPAPKATRLTDDATAGAAAGSLGKLLSTMELGSENTLDGLVRELLKPMIKEWLDANLAAIVEQKVEIEVQRIASMAR